MALKRFLFGTDSHGDMICPETAKAFLEFADDFKPHVRVCGGDLIDARPLRKGASAEEASENMMADLDAAQVFLNQYFAGVECEKVLTLGNHDHRIWELAQSSVAGIRAEYAFSLTQKLETKFAELGIQWLPYCVRKGRYQLGDLTFLHGYRHNIHCAKSHAEIFGSCIFGHVHRFSSHALAHVDDVTAYSCGSLCKTELPYNYKICNSLSHENGWFFGVVNEKTGAWEAWPVKKKGNEWLNPRTI